MKALFTVLLLLIALVPLHLSAQDSRQDVIYLKNGTVYRGVITEQIINVSYKIELAGGSVVVIQAQDVAKITKESGPLSPKEKSAINKPVREFHYKKEGYFFQAQAETEVLRCGARIINGYKFGRFGYVGLGLGMEIAYIPKSIPQDYIGGVLAPVYLYYSGDLFKKRWTPFYTAELGYAIEIKGNTAEEGHAAEDFSHREGGLTGGIGIGYKYIGGKANCGWSINADFVHVYKHVWGTDFYSGSSYSSSSSNIIYSFGARFSIGF